MSAIEQALIAAFQDPIEVDGIAYKGGLGLMYRCEALVELQQVGGEPVLEEWVVWDVPSEPPSSDEIRAQLVAAIRKSHDAIVEHADLIRAGRQR